MSEYGNENVDTVIALLNEEDECAIALPNATETSKGANFRLSAIHVKALIAVNFGQTEETKKEYERIVLFDPKIETASKAKAEINFLHDELEKMRKL